MSNDIGELARMAVRRIRSRDFRGDCVLSEDRCADMILDILKSAVDHASGRPDAAYRFAIELEAARDRALLKEAK